MGASIMSSVFSAFGMLRPLAIGVSPLALNVISRKTTVTTRKSIMLVSESDAFVERCPPPLTFFSTNSSPTWCMRRRVGFWMAMAKAPMLRTLSVHREGDVEGGHLLGLAAELHVAVRLVDGVDDADDVLELGLVVGVQDRLIELPVRRVRVLALGLPLGLDLRGQVGEANDFDAPLLGDDVLARDVDRIDRRAPLLPDQDELVVRAHLDVELLLGLDLFLFHVGPRGPGHLRVRIDAGHVRPYGRDEEERNRHHQQVDHRDHVDLRVELLAAAASAASDVYATHGLLRSGSRAPWGPPVRAPRRELMSVARGSLVVSLRRPC